MWNPRLTFVSSSRLSKAAGNEISRHAQRRIRSSVNVLDQHVHAGVLALGRQLKQLIKPLRKQKQWCLHLHSRPELAPKQESLPLRPRGLKIRRRRGRRCSAHVHRLGSAVQLVCPRPRELFCSPEECTYLCFSQQGSEAPKRSSTDRASPDPLKAVLRLYLLTRRTLHVRHLKRHFHTSACSYQTDKQPERLVQTSVLQPEAGGPGREQTKSKIHKDLLTTAANTTAGGGGGGRSSWRSPGISLSPCLCLYSTCPASWAGFQPEQRVAGRPPDLLILSAHGGPCTFQLSFIMTQMRDIRGTFPKTERERTCEHRGGYLDDGHPRTDVDQKVREDVWLSGLKTELGVSVLGIHKSLVRYVLQHKVTALDEAGHLIFFIHSAII